MLSCVVLVLSRVVSCCTRVVLCCVVFVLPRVASCCVMLYSCCVVLSRVVTPVVP